MHLIKMARQPTFMDFQRANARWCTPRVRGNLMIVIMLRLYDVVLVRDQASLAAQPGLVAHPVPPGPREAYDVEP